MSLCRKPSDLQLLKPRLIRHQWPDSQTDVVAGDCLHVSTPHPKAIVAFGGVRLEQVFTRQRHPTCYTRSGDPGTLVRHLCGWVTLSYTQSMVECSGSRRPGLSIMLLIPAKKYCKNRYKSGLDTALTRIFTSIPTPVFTSFTLQQTKLPN